MPAHVVRVAPESVADLTSVDLHWVRVPMLEPFVAAHGTEHDREVVLVRVTDRAGVTGWGECVALSRPTYTSEHTAGAWDVLGHLVPAVLRGDPIDVAACPMAWTALETALLDRRLRREGISLAQHLGATRSAVRATAVIGMQPTTDALLGAIGSRLDAGYQAVKVKIVPDGAVGLLRAVRERWPALEISADANGSYQGREDELAALGGLDLHYLEQPLAADDLAGHARARRATGLRVALDESVGSLEDLERAIAAGALDIVNLKPGRVGGIAESSRVVATARDAGVDVFVGGMLETGVGRAAALAFAGLDACTVPTDLGPSARYFADDVTPPIELLADGRMPVPAGPGLGVAPRPDRLDAITIRHVAVPAEA